MNKGSLFFHLHHHTLPRQRAGAERGGEERATTRTTCKKGDVVRPPVRWWKRCWPAAASSSPSRGRKRENDRRSRRPPAGSGGGERGDPFRKQAASPPPPFSPQPANGAGADGPSDEGDSARPQGGRGGKELRCGERRARDSKVARAHEGRGGGELPSSALLLERSRYHRGGCSTRFSLRRRRGGKGYRERGSGLRSPFLALHCHGSVLSLSLFGLARGRSNKRMSGFRVRLRPVFFRARAHARIWYGQTAEKRRRGAIGGIYQTGGFHCVFLRW